MGRTRVSSLYFLCLCLSYFLYMHTQTQIDTHSYTYKPKSKDTHMNWISVFTMVVTDMYQMWKTGIYKQIPMKSDWDLWLYKC
jgi:hypothetical protein